MLEDIVLNATPVMRSLRAALQAAFHEGVFGNAQFQGQGTDLIRGRASILLGKREHALDVARSKFGLSLVDGIAESADVHWLGRRRWEQWGKRECIFRRRP